MRIEEVIKDKIGICVSGGLDSRTLTRKLVDLGIDVTCFVADLAQPDEPNIKSVASKMAPCGASTVIVDLKNAMARACFEMIKAQAMYDGGYWNSTGIARAVTVRGLIPEMKKKGCTVLAHGATGRGNDQMRFERYTNVLAPDMKVYAPWRDPEFLKEFPGRKQMVEFLNKAGIEAALGVKKRYSTDANLAGISYEAEDLESIKTSCTIVKPQMGVWPEDAPDKCEIFTVRFEKGYAVKINGKKVVPLKAMLDANLIGGRNGIGIKNALENRIIGTKSRGVYESPGMELLGYCLMQVYHAVLDRRALELFKYLSGLIARQVYDGRYYDPTTRAAQSAIDVFAEFANATVAVELYKGNIHFKSLTDCSASLYNEADSSMEESRGLNPVSSQGFAEIQSVEAKSLAKAGQIKA
ncbi:MAG: argininosuccinate synthase [Kiritimatiellae bacterium]|nr:argininosuccinate synthase [Kiritimatiellia bacterium]MDD5521225.1 argininosuccinate synthase [Kiritimatiellia bacterium]